MSKIVLGPKQGSRRPVTRFSSLRFTARETTHEQRTKIRVSDLNVYYGEKHALKDISVEIREHTVTAFIGPSGCGKTTLLRCFNRLLETIEDARMEGLITIDDRDIHDVSLGPEEIRALFGVVAQKPDPFPYSIYDNVAYGARIHGLAQGRKQTDRIVRDTLERVSMWDEVKDMLKLPGTGLSGGQQQRLCIARAIAYRPPIVLMDEPCSALDPIATAHIEELIDNLRRDHTIIIVTHNLQQAARVSQYTAFFHLGRLTEFAPTDELFVFPKQQLTLDYVSGRYG